MLDTTFYESITIVFIVCVVILSIYAWYDYKRTIKKTKRLEITISDIKDDYDTLPHIDPEFCYFWYDGCHCQSILDEIQEIEEYRKLAKELRDCPLSLKDYLSIESWNKIWENKNEQN